MELVSFNCLMHAVLTAYIAKVLNRTRLLLTSLAGTRILVGPQVGEASRSSDIEIWIITSVLFLLETGLWIVAPLLLSRVGLGSSRQDFLDLTVK